MLLSFMLNLCDYAQYVHKLYTYGIHVWALRGGGMATLTFEKKILYMKNVFSKEFAYYLNHESFSSHEDKIK